MYIENEDEFPDLLDNNFSWVEDMSHVVNSKIDGTVNLVRNRHTATVQIPFLADSVDLPSHTLTLVIRLDDRFRVCERL